MQYIDGSAIVLARGLLEAVLCACRDECYPALIDLYPSASIQSMLAISVKFLLLVPGYDVRISMQRHCHSFYTGKLRTAERVISIH